MNMVSIAGQQQKNKVSKIKITTYSVFRLLIVNRLKYSDWFVDIDDELTLNLKMPVFDGYGK